MTLDLRFLWIALSIVLLSVEAKADMRKRCLKAAEAAQKLHESTGAGDAEFAPDSAPHLRAAGFPGKAHTLYSGVREITTSYEQGAYHLYDPSREVLVCNLNHSNEPEDLVEVQDPDNLWEEFFLAKDRDEIALLDAFWAAELTYDYFKDKLKQEAFGNPDGRIVVFANSSVEFDARWYYGVVLLGNEPQGTNPASLDIVAHELTHGISWARGLSSFGEAGALTEGLSDIWGACVEDYANRLDPSIHKDPWTVGEEVYEGSGIRSLKSPKDFGHPDTYKGEFWFPMKEGEKGQGSHGNSLVLGHWFYLLAQGGSGTNDQGHHYQITGLGIDKAARITYEAETRYLLPQSTYLDFRESTLKATEDIFGIASPEVKSVLQGWDAVGVVSPASP